MADAYWAQGTELRIGDGAMSESFTAIPGCESLTGPEFMRDMIEFFTHSSPGGFKERVSGPRDSGTVTCDIVWLGDDDAQNALQDAYASDDSVNFQMKLARIPENNLFSFAGYVQSLNSTAPTDNVHKRALVLQVTGPVSVDTE